MSRKILVADDSDAIRSVAVNVFRQKGHEVLTASGGSEAWEILKSGKIDLAIINSQLSDVDGYTISKRIKEDSSMLGTKALLMLSPSEIVNQRQLADAQPDGTLNKPFNPPDLLTKAGEILGEDFGMKQNKRDDPQQISVSDMGMNGEDSSEEIDFDSVFENDEEDPGTGDVHFAEILDEDNASGGKPKRPRDSAEDKDDEGIKLADDQFGLEEPFDPPEVETPHDYNWFIREMKNEIEDKGKDKKKASQPAQPRKSEKKAGSKSAEDLTGHFMVEEIDSAKVYSEEPEEQEKGFADTPDEFDQFSSGKKSGLVEDDEENKLLMVERLLVKELSRQLAQKIIDQIPRKKLHQIIDELFTELKKY
ncbi:MAG TPA: response regulator [candidate division Zixibacteria bacterium]|nr:response regulator [candidate division Zixibacteria bacterium]